MKKITVVVMALSLAVSIFSIANAGYGRVANGGCGNCPQNPVASANTTSDQLRKFQADTLDLRQEMMIKRFDVQRENLKATPDTARINALKADITAIQAKIQAIRDQSGLTNDKCDGECGQNTGGCAKRNMSGCSQTGKGGCNNGPCAAQK